MEIQGPQFDFLDRKFEPESLWVLPFLLTAVDWVDIELGGSSRLACVSSTGHCGRMPLGFQLRLCQRTELPAIAAPRACDSPPLDAFKYLPEPIPLTAIDHLDQTSELLK